LAPIVSIVIPVYNRRELVREAIDSALKEGEDVSVEVIVVDDCSTDDTWDVIGSFGNAVHRIRNASNRGQSVARNAGLDLARGKYVKFLDSDDVLAPGRLAREVEHADRQNADIVVSGWETRYADGTSREWGAPRFNDIVDDVLAGTGVPTSAALYRREKCVRWEPALRKLDDWDYFAQTALGVAKIVTEEGVSYEMREHSGSRVTDASMLVHAREHHIVLRKIETRLATEGRLTDARRKRLAQYYYKSLRVLSLHDREAFEAGIRHIFELDARFRPVDEERQAWMRLAARLIGPRRAILLHSSVKKLVSRV
jgi:glycosyltransferase involved in cell wall biosynthesis